MKRLLPIFPIGMEYKNEEITATHIVTGVFSFFTIALGRRGPPFFSFIKRRKFMWELWKTVLPIRIFFLWPNAKLSDPKPVFYTKYYYKNNILWLGLCLSKIMKEYYIFIAPACQNTTLKKRNQNKFDILNKNDFNFRSLYCSS